MNKYLKAKANLKNINESAKNDLLKLVIDSEQIYTNQIEKVVEDFFSSKQSKVILLSGPSSSGKTTTSNLIRHRLCKQGLNTIVISLDDFFINRDKTPKLPDGSYDFESVYALDLNYFNEFLDDLLNKKTAKMPLFDFLTGTRKKDYVDIEIDDNTVVIFEGIHALNPLLVNEKHAKDVYKIYICLNTDFATGENIEIPAKELRLMRRMLRDYYTRGHSISSTISMWKNVLDGEEKYIKPFKDTANFMIDSTHLYEPLLYATYLKPLIEKVENNALATRLLSYLNKCYAITKDCVPSASLLWEFLVHNPNKF